MQPTDYIRFLMALLFVIALMGGFYLLLKRFAIQGGIQIGAKRRLKIVEILPIDSRHKAILIRRDNEKEHLVILGTTGETIVETNITPPQNESQA
jgi:flagellar protein FliO/FliZ